MSSKVTLSRVDENGEPLWGTNDGRLIPFSEITHQHWSNIYWYHRYIYEEAVEGLEEGAYKSLTDYVEQTRDKCKHLMQVAVYQISKRFAGEILDWQPLYENEKKWYKKQSTRKILMEIIRK